MFPTEVFQGLQAFAAIVGMVFAGLAYWKGRQNSHAIAATTAKVTETHDLVNGQQAPVMAAAHAAGYREGVIDQAGGVAPGPYPPAPEPKTQ
jgi:hypothetical protein